MVQCQGGETRATFGAGHAQERRGEWDASGSTGNGQQMVAVPGCAEHGHSGQAMHGAYAQKHMRGRAMPAERPLAGLMHAGCTPCSKQHRQ